MSAAKCLTDETRNVIGTMSSEVEGEDETAATDGEEDGSGGVIRLIVKAGGDADWAAGDALDKAEAAAVGRGWGGGMWLSGVDWYYSGRQERREEREAHCEHHRHRHHSRQSTSDKPHCDSMQAAEHARLCVS